MRRTAQFREFAPQPRAGRIRGAIRGTEFAQVRRQRVEFRRTDTALEFEDILEEVAGVYPRIMKEGDLDAGAWSCGMVAGLIHDVPTVRELIDRIMAEADEIILDRLAGFMGVLGS